MLKIIFLSTTIVCPTFNTVLGMSPNQTILGVILSKPSTDYVVTPCREKKPHGQDNLNPEGRNRDREVEIFHMHLRNGDIEKAKKTIKK